MVVMESNYAPMRLDYDSPDILEDLPNIKPSLDFLPDTMFERRSRWPASRPAYQLPDTSICERHLTKKVRSDFIPNYASSVPGRPTPGQGPL